MYVEKKLIVQTNWVSKTFQRILCKISHEKKKNPELTMYCLKREILCVYQINYI